MFEHSNRSNLYQPHSLSVQRWYEVGTSKLSENQAVKPICTMYRPEINIFLLYKDNKYFTFFIFISYKTNYVIPVGTWYK